MKSLNRLQLILISLMFAVGIMTSAMAGEKSKKGGINWLDFEEAVAAAQKENKILLVDFYTDWCGWCKKMDKHTYGDPEVIKYVSKNMILSKVNAESTAMTSFKDHKLSYRQLAQAFRITGYPATTFIDENGDYITTVPGYITADKFIPIAKFLAEGHYKKMTYEEFLAKQSDNKS